MDESVGIRLAVLEETVGKMDNSQTKNFEKLFRILEGEGDENGLKTCVKMQGASLRRLYKWVAGLTILAAGFIEEFIRRNL